MLTPEDHRQQNKKSIPILQNSGNKKMFRVRKDHRIWFDLGSLQVWYTWYTSNNELELKQNAQNISGHVEKISLHILYQPATVLEPIYIVRAELRWVHVV